VCIADESKLYRIGKFPSGGSDSYARLRGAPDVKLGGNRAARNFTRQRKFSTCALVDIQPADLEARSQYRRRGDNGLSPGAGPMYCSRTKTA